MNKKWIRKAVGAILIAASLVVCAFPAGEVEAETASTSDFLMDEDKLVKYVGTAITVSIPSTVKVIGEEAFANNSNINKVTIPNSVEEISYAAFSGCNHLTSVSIPDSVEKIETAAFCNCSELSEVTIGKGLKKFGSGVFTGCDCLSEVKFDNTRFVCSKGAIMDDELETFYEMLPGISSPAYSMPNTITYIAPYSFYGISSLKSVTLSPYLMEISPYAFANCNGLDTVVIPYSVNTIDVFAFENCVNLADVNIPESVNLIKDSAFDGCPRLNIIAPELSYAYNWFLNMDRSQVAIIDSQDNYVPGKVINEVNTSSNANPVNTTNTSEGSFNGVSPTDGPYNFDNATQPLDGMIGQSVVIGRSAVVFINNLTPTVYGGSALNDDPNFVDLTDILQTETNGKGLSLPKFALIDNRVAGRAFYGDSSLTSYEIPDTVNEIGDFAFARSALTSITIPESVTKIGYGAFYHCDNLSQILIPNTVVDIEPYALDNTRMISNWLSYGEGDYLICGDGILVAYRGKDSRITIPEGVKQIGPEAFKDHKGITDLYLPDSLWRICEDAFSGCSNLKNVNGGANVTTIEDRAFAGCPLQTIRIADHVTSIGLSAFDVSSTVLSDDCKVCVFLGDTLPTVSYNKTTTRLSNENYRKDALNDVKVCIVSSESVNRAGTVLDRSLMGFSGLVCTVESENNEYFNGALHIIDCTLTSKEAETFTVPLSIEAFGKGYNFSENELSKVLEMAKAGEFEKTSDSTESLPTSMLSSMSGSSKMYLSGISMDASVNEELKNAYVRIYGDTVPSNFTTYQIYAHETDNDILLTKFGKQTMSITMPLPNNITTQNLHVICTDEDGQLEDLPYKVVEENNQLCVKYEISHTGHYGLYAFNSTSVSNFDLDDSPDTGDYLHPKWFLALGLFAAGAATLLIKGKERKAI